LKFLFSPTPRRRFVSRIALGLAGLWVGSARRRCLAAETSLRLAVFDVDATPPLGAMMAYDPVRRIDDLSLRCRGVVILGAGEPIVLCALDWLGLSNESHDAFRSALAAAAGTSVERTAVQTLHQHDAPWSDFTAERLLKEAGATDLGRHDGAFARVLLARTAEAIRAALEKAQPISQYGWGEAEVKEVASNRRVMGPDGKVKAVRWSATKDPAVRAEPEGLIDPKVSLLSFWNGETPVAILSYYACHPQSYYRTGIPSPDFPGIARFVREQSVPEALHVHFNGAGGNITAGKYNDGSHENRMTLALRLADGMKRAWEATAKSPLAASDIQWRSEAVALPPADCPDEAKLRADLGRAPLPGVPSVAAGAADRLAWLASCRAGHKTDITLLAIGNARVLHMPGELFVEYQLAAKQMRPDLRVTMAAYGDRGPGYIGTARAYPEGGYETEPRSSYVTPEVEEVLMSAMRRLLEAR
jgi:hypothetical protein